MAVSGMATLADLLANTIIFQPSKVQNAISGTTEGARGPSESNIRLSTNPWLGSADQ